MPQARCQSPAAEPLHPARSRRVCHGLLACLLPWLMLGCGGQQATAATPAKSTAQTPLHRGPVTDYVPAAGLRWLLVGSPRALYASPELAKALTPLLPATRLDAFKSSSGVDLRTLESGCIAGFDLGTLYLAQVTSEGSDLERAFRARLVTEPREHTRSSELFRITGLVGNTPESFIGLAGHLAGVAVGDITLARVVEGFASQQLRRSKPALAGAALSTLPERLHRYPMRFYAPGPLDAQWQQGAGGLLEAALAVGLGAEPRGPMLHLEGVVSGDFGASEGETEQRVSEVWERLRLSELGRLLGLAEVTRPPSIKSSAKELSFELELPLERAALGLHAAVSASMPELFGQPQPAARPSP